MNDGADSGTTPDTAISAPATTAATAPAKQYAPPEPGTAEPGTASPGREPLREAMQQLSFEERSRMLSGITRQLVMLMSVLLGAVAVFFFLVLPGIGNGQTYITLIVFAAARPASAAAS